MSIVPGKKLRILLVQLPPPDPSFRYARSNVPLAAGYLKAYARATLGEAVAIDILASSLAAGGGDAAVLAAMEAGKYDVIGFSLYLWNVERSLALARQLKARRPVTVVMGGPEVLPGRRLCLRPEADVFVAGEGEAVFVDILSRLLEGERPERLYQSPAPLDLVSLPDPWLTGALEISPGAVLHVETMRGCPRRCAYCCYGKSRPGPRYFPRERSEAIFALAAAAGASEIYLMDPSFELRPRFDDFLLDIRAWNKTRIPLHTELSLEAVTEERAALMQEAGFVSVEAGLQSTHRRALAAVKRPWDRPRFLKGARLLRERNIEVRTGIILGLPHDGLEDFGRTLDFIAANDLADGAEVYPLSLLPGSALSTQAEKFGIEAMPLPPYWALKTDALEFPDFFRAETLVRDKLGKSLFEQLKPHFSGHDSDFIQFQTIGSAADLARLGAAPDKIGNSLTLLLSGAMADDSGLLERLARTLHEHNPHTLLQIVIDSDRDIPDAEAVRISDLFFSPAAYLNRCHAFDDDPQGRFSVRLFALMDDAARVLACNDRGSFIDPILRYRAGALAGLKNILARERPLLLIPAGVPAAELDELLDFYSDTKESLLYYGNENTARV